MVCGNQFMPYIQRRFSLTVIGLGMGMWLYHTDNYGCNCLSITKVWFPIKCQSIPELCDILIRYNSRCLLYIRFTIAFVTSVDYLLRDEDIKGQLNLALTDTLSPQCVFDLFVNGETFSNEIIWINYEHMYIDGLVQERRNSSALATQSPVLNNLCIFTTLIPQHTVTKLWYSY